MVQIFFLLLIFAGEARADGILPNAELDHVRSSIPCVLEFVLKNNGQKFDPSIPLPKLVYSHEISVDEFNQKMKNPYLVYPTVQNAFIAGQNTIYLDSRTVVYAKYGKTLIDSLAHELTHYMQHFYLRFTEVEAYDDPAESMAIRIQFRYREEDSKNGLCRN